MSEEAASGPIELVSDIVSAYVSKNSVPPGELPGLIQSVYQSLVGLGQPAEPEPMKLTPPVPIKKSVTPDHIISLEDGRPYKSLKRHLTTRGLSPAEYRQKWGLPSDYPMGAANYAAQRSELAKSLGLGQQRRKAAAEKRAAADAKVSAPASPKKGRSKKGAASE
ncbi:MucR family transcriptional regulator [Methylobacterium oryzisoli]|uniref:MucR family transcriptional regulator n=1 Tax=Methylobacterium oryzisoli TaxID=3385502 RepID=UPI00389210DE